MNAFKFPILKIKLLWGGWAEERTQNTLISRLISICSKLMHLTHIKYYDWYPSYHRMLLYFRQLCFSLWHSKEVCTVMIFGDFQRLQYSLSAPWSSPAITNSVWGSHWFILHLMKSLARPWAALHEDATSFNRCFKEISTRGLRVNPTAPNGSQDNFSCRIKWIIEILRTNETSNVHFYLVILIILINKNFPRKPDIDKIRKSRNSCWFVILTF